MNTSNTFFGHPIGLKTLFLTEMWERMSYYGMRALLVLYMTGAVTGFNPGLGWSQIDAQAIYGIYVGMVYFMVVPGGWIADNILGHQKAVLIGAFIIQGVTPGPLMFVQQPALVNGIYLSMICASLLLLFIGFFGQKVFALLSLVSLRMIIPSVIFFCSIGAYLQGGGIIGVWLILFFGIFGYLAKKLDFSFLNHLQGFGKKSRELFLD